VNLSPLQEFPLVQRTPAVRRRPRQAGLLARGLTPAHHLPGLSPSGWLLQETILFSLDAGTPLTVAGAARALHPVPMTRRSRRTVRENFYFVN
jgi:hypothetical protein